MHHDAPASKASVDRRQFGALPDGTRVDLYTLANGHGTAVDVATYGGTVVSLRTRDAAGRLGDVVLGHDTLEGYLSAGNGPYLGALIGRFGNRIARGRFMLGGRVHQLACNDGPNHLHGGLRGFDKRVWSAEAGTGPEGASVRLGLVSEDGEEGYPGRLAVTVTMTLDDADQLRLDYAATADAPTHCNLTHHGYFDLDGGADVLGHLLTLHASRFLPVDEGLIPTGELRPVTGTPMDFTNPTAVGTRIDAADEQLRRARGYDHCWVLDGGGAAPALAAEVTGPASGRRLEVFTTEPGVQFYSGNFLDGSVTGKGGRRYGRRAGLCLETQHFPDSPNHPSFPGTLLVPGQAWWSTTVFRFSADAPGR